MNAVINHDGMPVTMTSREIAELTGKEHKHVLRDIRAMLDELEKDGPVLDHPMEDKDSRGYTSMFHLNRELTDTLLTGYSAVLRRKVIARWHELEAGQAAPDPVAMLNDPAAMRGLLLGYTEKVIELEKTVAEQAPAVEGYKRIADAEGSITIREAANTLRVPERQFVLWLQQHRWCYRRAGHKSLLAYSDRTAAGHLWLKQTPIRDVHTGMEKLSEQVRVTPLGLTVLARKLGPDYGAPLQAAG